MMPAMVRKLVYPLHELLRHRRTFANLCELEATQWWGADRLGQLQAEKLRSLFLHATQQCPFYRRRFSEAGVDSESYDAFGALNRLPLLDKETIRANRDDLTWWNAPGGVHQAATGGSTGEPLLFNFDRRRQGYDKAARMRTHRWYGVDVGERELYLWGSPHELDAQDRVKAWRDRMTNELLLSAFDLTPQRLDEYLDRLEQFAPRCLFGYPSSLQLLCRHGRSRGRRVSSRSLAAVFVTGELFDDGQRRDLEAYFGVPAANCYGSREAGFIAHDCPAGSMHVTDENVVVEIVGSDGRLLSNGQVGEVVITHLDAYAMPLIRYRTGDLGRRVDGACACGRGLSRMEIVGGRRTDHLVGTDGTVMHGLSVIYILREMDSVRWFRVRQDATGAVRVEVVPTGQFSETDRAHIDRSVRELLGRDVELEIVTVERIDACASGKYRCVVSEASEEVVV